MLEVGWSEILVIAVILIIVVGPKDLPGMLRTFGRMAARVRNMANEFKGQFDDALREAELDDVRKGLDEVNKYNPSSVLRDAMNPIRKLGEDIKSDLKKASDSIETSGAATPVTPSVEASKSIPAASEAHAVVVKETPPVPAVVSEPQLPAVAETAKLPVATAKPKTRRTAKTAVKGEKQPNVLSEAAAPVISPSNEPKKPRARKAPVAVAEAPAPRARKTPAKKKTDSAGDA